MNEVDKLSPRGYLAASQNEGGAWSFLDITFEEGCAVKIETENFVWNRD